MQKLRVRSTNKKGRVKVREFTEKQSAQALLFMCKEFAKGNIIEKEIVKDGTTE